MNFLLTEQQRLIQNLARERECRVVESTPPSHQNKSADKQPGLGLRKGGSGPV